MTQDTSSRNHPPVLRPITDFTFAHVRQMRLDNGIPVYFLNAGVQDVIKVELIFRNAGFNPEKPLMHHATNRLISEGTSKHTAQQLAERIDYYGAYFETDQHADWCSVILHTLGHQLRETLPVVYEMITDATFPERELMVYKQNNKQRLLVENEKVASIARRKFAGIIFGPQHPYGYFVLPEDYERLTRSDLQSFHRSKYVSNHCEILVSGKVNDGVLQTLNQIFGGAGWMSGNGINAPIEQVRASSETRFFIEKPDAIQSAIRIGRKLFNKTHYHYPGMQVLNTLLGGYFGSRLMKNIREDKGYTYGIGSAVVSHVQDGYFFIASEVGADVCARALEEVYKEIHILQKETIPAEELQMVKNYMMGTFLKSIDGAFHLADRWKSILFYNLNYDYFDRFVHTVQSISAEEIRELARTYLDKEALHELVVGRK